MSNLEADRPLPTFISSNQASSPFFYFHHIVNPEEATVTVQVIGPNLEFKFTHSRAKVLLSRSDIEARIVRKTTGFLALVTPTGERVVLTAAESGHGAGKLGDMLDARPGVLANLVWTTRAVAVGRLLGLTMERPFDTPGRRRILSRDGIFQGSHVELKLSVHGIMENGTRPSFEVYFSRKNCATCGKFVRTLEEATGVSIKLLWKPRLELTQYRNVSMMPSRPRGPQPEPEIIDDQDLDFGDGFSEDDSDDETVGGEDREDLRVIPMVDLISHPSFSETPAATDSVDDYINGLAYRVGQMESSPDGAAEAIVQFAHRMRGDNIKWTLSQQNINKPLPATPEIDPPAWMRACGSEPRSQPSPSNASDDGEFPGRNRSSSPCERAVLRDRSPRRYTTGRLDRTVLGRGRSRICVEIPARRRSAEESLFV
ncbi:hypothetical protein G7Z17_g4514 [Cylindrodendrum hubeiense]|uniref:Uncharacterized protein n=1 Tax=Cylindrodendrum hubeiense TaxID=595255 RepID=A0A9P5HCP2_9HYPO|nr:hypothetical protein G7Z17_g4514 [Cylindrodendrum hubeiense]